MKKIIIHLTLMIIVALSYQTLNGEGSLAAETKNGTSAAPKMVLPQPDFDFGKVMEGAHVAHAFIIENHGEAPLHIVNVHTSCGCTTAQKPESIAPGARESIVVQANTEGYGGRGFNKTITIATDDPGHPTAQLRLRGQVARFARIWPQRILLQGKAGDSVKAEATITPAPEYPFKIVNCTMDDGLTGKIAVTVTERNGTYNLLVVNRQTLGGAYFGKIFLETDHSFHPQLALYVRGRIDGE